MCCGAIMASGIATLVMGARHKPGEKRWGAYKVEKLLELTPWSTKLEVVTDILPQECLTVLLEWEARNADR